MDHHGGVNKAPPRLKIHILWHRIDVRMWGYSLSPKMKALCQVLIRIKIGEPPPVKCKEQGVAGRANARPTLRSTRFEVPWQCA